MIRFEAPHAVEGVRPLREVELCQGVVLGGEKRKGCIFLFYRGELGDLPDTVTNTTAKDRRTRGAALSARPSCLLERPALLDGDLWRQVEAEEDGIAGGGAGGDTVDLLREPFA
jgi:hypothetical protein